MPEESRLEKYVQMFLHHTLNYFRGYIQGLVPRTKVIYFTNPYGRRMICIYKEWMGKTLKEDTRELNELNPEIIDWIKRNLPRMQEIVHEYGEEQKKATVDKTA